MAEFTYNSYEPHCKERIYTLKKPTFKTKSSVFKNTFILTKLHSKNEMSSNDR